MQYNTTLTSLKLTLPLETHTICLPHKITPDDRAAPVFVGSGGVRKTLLMHHGMTSGTVTEQVDT